MAQLTAARIGSKAGTNVLCYERGAGVVRHTKLVMDAMPVTLTDESTVTIWSGTKIYDFPEGLLVIHGALINGALTAVSAAATYDGDVALGSTTADNTATPMVTTQCDILTNTAMTQASSKVAVCDAVSSATNDGTDTGARYLDGTTTAKDMYLNFLIDESASNATHVGSFTGWVEFVWTILGDK